jgi:hypothetical protein
MARSLLAVIASHGLAASLLHGVPTTTTSAPAAQSSSAPASSPSAPASQTATHSPREEPFYLAIENAVTPQDKASAQLALAQDILVTRCADGMSSLVCCPSEDVLDLAALLDEGLAASRMAESIADGKDITAEAQVSIKQRAELLDTFGKLFRALADTTVKAEPRNRAILDACGNLAGYFDDPNEAVVESARFWQGAAYRVAGRADRALAVLRPAISTPEARRLGLLARLQRCLALGDQHQYVAALALCLKLEARLDSWFEDQSPDEQKKAQDSARWVRIALMRDWAGRLKKSGEAKHAGELLAEAQKLQGTDPDPPTASRWLSLSATIEGLGEWKLAVAPPTTSQAGG